MSLNGPVHLSSLPEFVGKNSQLCSVTYKTCWVIIIMLILVVCRLLQLRDPKAVMVIYC